MKNEKIEKEPFKGETVENMESVESTELAAQPEVQITKITDDDGEEYSMDFSTDSKQFYCSLKSDSLEDKVTIFNAANNPDKKLSEMINMVIKFKHFYADEIVITDNKTGLKKKMMRCVIIDEDGKAYTAMSKGVYQSIRALFNTFGEPATWKEAIPIVVQQKTIGSGENVRNILKFGLVFGK